MNEQDSPPLARSDRRQRLAEALRENLKRRKAQSRSRSDPPTPPAKEPKSSD